MDYILLFRILLSTMVLPTVFAIEQPLFKSFGLANDEPDNLDVDQRSDEAFTIVGLDTNDAQAAKRLEFLKQQMPNPMRNRLRFGSRLRETKQVEKISANKQLPPAIRRFFKLSQNKQNVDTTTNSTDLPVTVTFTMASDATIVMQNIGPVVIVATDAPATTTTATPATATATATTATTSTAPDTTGTTYPSSTTGTTSTTTTTTPTTSTTTTPTTITSTTITTPSTTTSTTTTTPSSTVAVTYPASTTDSTTTTTMMLPDSTVYPASSNAISDTSNDAMPPVPSAAVKRKIHPFSNRVGSSKKSSVFIGAKLHQSGASTDNAKPAKNRFVFRVSQASSDSYSSSLAPLLTETSMVPMDASTTTMMSTSSDDGYYDSTDAPSTVAVVIQSVTFMDTSMASSTVAALTSSVASVSSDDGYYDSTDAPSTSAVVTSSAVPMDTSVAPSTIASLTSSMSAVSSDDGYYDATDASSTAAVSIDTTVSAATSVTPTTPSASMATSLVYSSSSSNTKSCKPDSGVRTTSQGGVCVSTLDLGTVCEAKFRTFEAGQSTSDCAGFDGNWCCYMPASVVSSKGRDADGNEE